MAHRKLAARRATVATRIPSRLGVKKFGGVAVIPGNITFVSVARRGIRHQCRHWHGPHAVCARSWRGHVQQKSQRPNLRIGEPDDEGSE